MIGAKAGVKRVQIEATVIRADGTVEKLGTISDSRWHRFSLRRLISSWRTKQMNQAKGLT